MARDRKKDRISRIRNNLKYENDDPIWKKLFYITENLKQYKGVVIALGITVFLVILAIFFSTMSKNSVRKNDIVITEQVNTGNIVDKKKEFASTEDIEKYIDEIASGAEVENGKPAPDVFLLAAERLGVDAKDCLILEDSKAGIKAGKASGAMVFMVPDMFTVDKECEDTADRILTNLGEVIEILEGKNE